MQTPEGEERAFPGAAPDGLERSDTSALATGTLPSFRAFEKKAAQLAAKARSSSAGELQPRYKLHFEPMSTLLSNCRGNSKNPHLAASAHYR